MFSHIGRYLLVTLVGVAICLFLFYKFWFLRRPRRFTDTHTSTFLSPASGKVIACRSTANNRIPITKKNHHVLDIITKKIGGKGPYTVVSIMMTPRDVHVQRAPTDAVCTEIVYRPGTFYNVVSGNKKYRATRENEANVMYFNYQQTHYAVLQIAGCVARKIRCEIIPGQEVKKGSILGCILLGSQVTVVLDNSITPTVQVGQYLYDGESILGLIKDRSYDDINM